MEELLKFVPYKYIQKPDCRTTLYCVSCLDFIKIGISKQFETRFKDLQGANPFPLAWEFTRTVPTAAAIQAEAAIHDALKQFHHRGEWFRCSPEQAKPAFKTAVRRAIALKREWSSRLHHYGCEAAP